MMAVEVDFVYLFLSVVGVMCVYLLCYTVVVGALCDDHEALLQAGPW